MQKLSELSFVNQTSFSYSLAHSSSIILIAAYITFGCTVSVTGQQTPTDKKEKGCLASLSGSMQFQLKDMETRHRGTIRNLPAKNGDYENRLYVNEAPTLTGFSLLIVFFVNSNINTKRPKRYNRHRYTLSSMLDMNETLLPSSVFVLPCDVLISIQPGNIEHFIK